MEIVRRTPIPTPLRVCRQVLIKLVCLFVKQIHHAEGSANNAHTENVAGPYSDFRGDGGNEIASELEMDFSFVIIENIQYYITSHVPTTPGIPGI